MGLASGSSGPRLFRLAAASGWSLTHVVDALRWLTLAVLFTFSLFGQPATSWVGGYAVAALALYNLAITLFRPRLGRWLGPAWLFAVDGLVVSLGVLVTGGLPSSLFVLYYLIVIGSALHLSTLENVAFTVLLAIAYLGVASLPAPHLLDLREVERLAVRLTLLLIVAIVSSVLTRQLRDARQTAQREREAVAQLSVLNEQLQQLERMKSDFLSAVSHDFKTPLTSIKASIGLLLDALGGDRDLPTTRLCRNIARNVDRLDALVSELLDMARLQSGRIVVARQSVQMEEVLTSAVATMRPLCAGREQRLVLDVASDLPPVLGDQRRLEQVVVNLLSNANNYAPRRSEIRLEAAVDGPYLRITIIDQGPGVAPGERPHIFDRFYRSDHPVVRRRAGSGLGLAIAKSLVDLHGGEIWVDAGPGGRGGAFHFTLPVQLSGARPAETAAVDDARAAPAAAAGERRHPAVRPY